MTSKWGVCNTKDKNITLNLELIKLDTMQGNVSIKGVIKGLTYIEELKNKEKEQGIFNRLFK